MSKELDNTNLYELLQISKGNFDQLTTLTKEFEKSVQERITPSEQVSVNQPVPPAPKDH